MLSADLRSSSRFDSDIKQAKLELMKAVRAGSLTLWAKPERSPNAPHEPVAASIFLDFSVTITEAGRVLGDPDLNALFDYRGPTYLDGCFYAIDVIAIWPPFHDTCSPILKKIPRVDYRKSDAKLCPQMDRLLEESKARSKYDAALTVAGKAEGFGSPVSKAKRLVGRYNTWKSENSYV